MKLRLIIRRCHPDKVKSFLLLGLVDVGTAFAQVEVHLVSGVAALQLQQSRVLTLVPQPALVAGEDGLTPQSDTHIHTVSSNIQRHLCGDSYFLSFQLREEAEKVR